MARTLLQHGWTNVRPLLGGLNAWLEAGYPTEARSAGESTFSRVTENARKRE